MEDVANKLNNKYTMDVVLGEILSKTANKQHILIKMCVSLMFPYKHFFF